MSDFDLVIPGSYDLTARDYHQHHAWGSTSLKAMRKGPPARVLWEQENPRHTAAMALGTALHMLVLQPDLFQVAYAHKPDGMSFATKEGKAWRDEHEGQSILSSTESATLMAMSDALFAKTLANVAITSAVARENSIFWTDADTGEACKGRLDLRDEGYIYDLKVSRYAGSDLAYRAFVEGWMHQLAHYRSGCAANGLDLGARLIVVHPVAPHFVYTLEVKPDALDLLAIENSQTLYALGQCRKANHWPGTPDEWTRIEPPPSALIASTVLELVEDVDG